MVDFRPISATHPLKDDVDDQQMLDHAFEKAASYIVRKNGVYYEAIKGGTATLAGTIMYGGVGHAGGISGTSAVAVIQACTTALAPLGGKIYIKSAGANIPITTSITYGASITFEGDAPSDDTANTYGTSLARTTDAPIFTSGAGTLRHISFKNICFMGVAKGTGTTGLIKIGNTTMRVLFENCVFRTSGGAGVDLDGASWGVTMIHCAAQSLTGALVTKITPDTGTTLTMHNCIATYGGPLADLYGMHTIDIGGGGGDNFDAEGIRVSTCSGSIHDIDIEGPATGGHGIHVITSAVNVFGNRIYLWGDAATYFPIYLSGVSGGTNVFGNSTASTTANYAIGFSGDAESFNIYGNRLDKKVTGWTTAVKGKFWRNDGFITENTGVATLTAGFGSVKVAHGLTSGYEPTVVILSATTLWYGEHLHVSSLDSDGDKLQFTVTISNIDAVHNISFNWYAVTTIGS